MAYISYKTTLIPWIYNVDAPKNKKSTLASLLFGGKVTHPKGRVIRFDETAPDIKLSTGSMGDRIRSALDHSIHPLTCKEIAERIGSNQPRVSSRMRQLVIDGIVTEVKLEGCVSEFTLLR